MLTMQARVKTYSALLIFPRLKEAAVAKLATAKIELGLLQLLKKPCILQRGFLVSLQRGFS